MTFVGREPELATMDAVLAQLASGRGGVILVAGEAGLGKSTLLQLLSEKTAVAGLRALWGRCSEEPGAPLFWPWIQLLRDWLNGRDLTAVNEVSPGSAGLVVRLLSPQSEPASSAANVTEPENAELSRFLFMQAMAQFWGDAAAQAPLVLIIDDLHRDKSASLKLLATVAEANSRAPLLIAAAYRREETRAGQALRDLLGGLLGRSHVQQLVIDGLSVTESERLVSVLTGSDPPPGLRREIAARSEGNPLFLRELSRELARSGTPNDTAVRSSLATNLPDSIRILFEQRLERLGPSARQVLEIAATIGRRFDHQTVAALASHLSAADVTQGLEEALESRLITELSELGRYQFIHELLRETVYESVPAPRRMVLHRAVAEWIETHHKPALDLHLSRLAYHYSQAVLIGVGDKAIEYQARAGRQAEKLHFHEEAAGYFREALRLDLALGGNYARELIPALGEMEILAGAAEAAEQTFENAVDMARSSGDPLFFARAVLGLEHATWRLGRDERPVIPLIDEALAAAEALPGKVVIELYSTLCRANALAGERDKALDAYDKSVAAARTLGDPQALFQSLRALVATRFWPELLDARINASREGLAIAQASGHLDWAISGTIVFLFLDLVEAGEMDEARRVIEIQREGARLGGDRFVQLVGEHLRIMLMMLERVDASVEDQIAWALQTGLRWGPSANAAGVHGTQMFTLRRFQGRLGELKPALRQYLAQSDAAATWGPALALVYCELGMLAEGRSVFDRIARNGFATVSKDARWGISMAYLAEACVALGDGERASELYEKLLPYSGRNIVTTTVCLGAVDRYLGLLAGAKRDWPAATAHLNEARAFSDRCDHPIWRAFAEADLAAVLVEKGDPMDETAAKKLLRSGLVAARALGVIALKNRCLAIRARLPGENARPNYPDGLTQAEIKVLRLLAAGATNKAIGRKLTLSPHTVAAHVRNILGKTETANRTEAANYAGRHGLVGDAVADLDQPA